MDNILVQIISACVPIIVALVGIIPAVVSNRKKTEESINKLKEDNVKFSTEIRGTINTINSDITNLNSSINTINDTVNMINNDLTELSGALVGHIKENEELSQKQRRIRIMRFVDEISGGYIHTQDHWDEIWEDVNQYEGYVKTHPDYINNKGVASMNFIKNRYEQMLKNKAQC